MAYTPQGWADGSSGGTPITAARLTHIEDGVEDADTRLDAVETGKAPLVHTHPVGDLTASGTPSSSTFLRGDGAWAAPAGGGGGGAVDSVNGQTGTVSLGLVDLDDVQTTGATVGQVVTVSSVSSGGPSGFGLVEPWWGALVAAPTGVQATDEASISAAVAAAGAGGLVQFTSGTYVADGMAPLTGQVWVGNDTTIARPSTSTSSLITATGVDDVTLRGLRFDGARATSGATSNPLVILIDAARPRVLDCTFENTPATNAALIYRGTVSGLVQGCRFANVGYAIVVGLNLGDAYESRDNVVTGNVVDTTDWNAVFFTENLGSTSFSTTVAAASDGQALPQTTITVAATSGFPTAGRVRIGGYGGPVVAYTGKTGTTLTGCTVISGAGTLTTGQAVQIAVQGLVQGTTFVGNTVRAYGDCGVESGSGSVGTVISGNSFYGSALSNQSILFRDARDCSATGNTCANNTKTGAGVGIYLLNLNGTTERIALTGNRIFGNSYCGVLGENVRDVTISGGQVSDTGRVGIRLRNIAGAEITGVAVLRSGEGGIELGQAGTNAVTDGVVTGCRIMDNNQTAVGSGSGLLLFGATTALVSGNRIGDRQTVKTQVYGVRVFDSAVSADITGNDLSGNVTAGIQNFGSSTAIRVVRNRGFNPQGMQSVTPGASPWTYTAGITPEVVYVGGATGASVTKGGFSAVYSTSAGGVFPLEPGEQVVVTYTSPTPTVRVDRK